MVPFSFPQPLLKSRVMIRQFMVESLELRAEGVQRDQRHAGPNCGGTAREDSRPTKGAARFRENSVILSKVKTTKRTQFEKCKFPIKH